MGAVVWLPGESWGWNLDSSSQLAGVPPSGCWLPASSLVHGAPSRGLSAATAIAERHSSKHLAMRRREPAWLSFSCLLLGQPSAEVLRATKPALTAPSIVDVVRDQAIPIATLPHQSAVIITAQRPLLLQGSCSSSGLTFI